MNVVSLRVACPKTLWSFRCASAIRFSNGRRKVNTSSKWRLFCTKSIISTKAKVYDAEKITNKSKRLVYHMSYLGWWRLDYVTSDQQLLLKQAFEKQRKLSFASHIYISFHLVYIPITHIWYQLVQVGVVSNPFSSNKHIVSRIFTQFIFHTCLSHRLLMD